MPIVGQFVTRIDEETALAIDRLVESGYFDSRSDAVRYGLAAILEAHRRGEVGRQIIEGYERIPETETELELADNIARIMIAEEPWEGIEG